MSCICDCHESKRISPATYSKYAPADERTYTPAVWQYAKERCSKCERHHFTYAELRERGNKVSSEKLAPLEAHAKYSKGNNPRYEFKQQTIKNKGITVELKDLKIKWGKVR